MKESTPTSGKRKSSPFNFKFKRRSEVGSEKSSNKVSPIVNEKFDQNKLPPIADEIEQVSAIEDENL